MDFGIKTAFPFLVRILKEYYAKNTPDFIKDLPQETTKTSSITLLIKISDHENVYGQALLDFITNHPRTKHISYKKQNFILNQSEEIELVEGVFASLKEQKQVDESEKGDIEQQV